MATSEQFVDTTTAAALEEKAKLQKHFNRFDIYFFLICTIVGVDTLGQVAQNGAQGFLWLLVLAVVFFVPYALLTAELGSAFTEEGGQYVWTRMSYGRLVAAINAIFYWFSNPRLLVNLGSSPARRTSAAPSAPAPVRRAPGLRRACTRRWCGRPRCRAGRRRTRACRPRR